MLNNKTIAVVITAYNEEKQIGKVIETIPDFVDRIVIVNDCSKDNTGNVIEKYIGKDKTKTIKIKNVYNKIEPNKYNLADILIQQELVAEIQAFTPSEVVNKDTDDDRIILINHKKNAGVGAVVATGYKWCKDHDIDCIVKIDGDGQMDPGEINNICKPVIVEGIDYVKGNRLLHRSSWLVIPRIRFMGNSILSILTKIASGYWHVSDTQTAFTAISKDALHAIDLKKLYKSYGYPNDILVRLNIAFCTLKEVEIKPVYSIGEKSKMKIFKVILPISMMLLRSFFKRLWIKYLFRDFHPLFILYHMALILLLISIPYIIKILRLVILGIDANPTTVLAFVFLFISGFQSLLFAMWMDMQDNERLYK